MPLNTNHPTPPKGASCSKVGIPEGVPRFLEKTSLCNISLWVILSCFAGRLIFLGGFCFGLGCNLQDVLVILIEGGSMDKFRNRSLANEIKGDRREVTSIGLFLLSLILLEVVVQLLGGK
jgi:hypothetical protein